MTFPLVVMKYPHKTNLIKGLLWWMYHDDTGECILREVKAGESILREVKAGWLHGIHSLEATNDRAGLFHLSTVSSVHRCGLLT